MPGRGYGPAGLSVIGGAPISRRRTRCVRPSWDRVPPRRVPPDPERRPSRGPYHHEMSSAGSLTAPRRSDPARCRYRRIRRYARPRDRGAPDRTGRYAVGADDASFGDAKASPASASHAPPDASSPDDTALGRRDGLAGRPECPGPRDGVDRAAERQEVAALAARRPSGGPAYGVPCRSARPARRHLRGKRNLSSK